MSAVNPVVEGELEYYLREDPDYALRHLYENYRLEITQHIKWVTWGMLRPEELKDAFQETMLALVQKVREPGFDPSRPLRMVKAIARNKALDILRERRRHRVNTNHDAILDALAENLQGSDVAFGHGLLSPSGKVEFWDAVVAIVLTLPERQRVVARAFIDNFEDFGARDTYRPLADAVSAITGQMEDVVAVKSAWREAREKIRAGLVERGYGFIDGSAP